MPEKNEQLASVEKEEGEKSMEVDYIVSDEAGYDSAQTEKLGIGRVTRKLLTWGVETRGAFIENSLSRAQTERMHRHIPCPTRTACGQANPQDILRLVFYELQHPFVRATTSY